MYFEGVCVLYRFSKRYHMKRWKSEMLQKLPGNYVAGHQKCCKLYAKRRGWSIIWGPYHGGGQDHGSRDHIYVYVYIYMYIYIYYINIHVSFHQFHIRKNMCIQTKCLVNIVKLYMMLLST